MTDRHGAPPDPAAPNDLAGPQDAAGPTIAAGPDKPVGETLLRMRKALRLTGKELAARVGMSQPKISRIERGQAMPDPEDIAAIARELGADEDLVRVLRERVETEHDRLTDWRPTAVGLAGRQYDVARWESTARTRREFQPALVPGLLQTSGYARSVLLAFQSLDVSEPRPPADNAGQAEDGALLAAVSARVRRQEVLADEGKDFRFVMTETVLRTRFCPPIEMLAQVSRLREIAAGRRNVDIRILPDEATIDIPPLHGFVLLDDNMIVVDVFNTGLISRGRNDARQYRQVFDWFEGRAETDIDPILARYEALYIESLRTP